MKSSYITQRVRVVLCGDLEGWDGGGKAQEEVIYT